MDFKAEVLDIKGKVLVDFWAEWCGPCKMLAPIIDEISQEIDNLKIVKVDVDSYPEIASSYGVSSIPTVVIFEDGQVKDTIVGFHQKADYLAVLK
jgi:thioredoxin 1